MSRLPFWYIRLMGFPVGMLLLALVKSIPHWISLSPAVTDAMAAPDRVYIYSLEKESDYDGVYVQLDGWIVAGRAALNAEQTQRAIAVLEEAIPKPHWQWGSGTASSCFTPHHALRIEHAGHVFDFLISYQCHELMIFGDGETVLERSVVQGSSNSFDDLLRAAGLPVLDESAAPEGHKGPISKGPSR